MPYGDYSRFEPQTHENMSIPEKLDNPAISQEKQANPKTSIVSHSILNAPKKLPEEADSLTKGRLKKDPPSDDVPEKANAIGTPVLLQRESGDDAMDLLQQEELYAKQKMDALINPRSGESASSQRDFAAMTADELEMVLNENLSDEEINKVLQRLDELSAVLIEEGLQLDEQALQLDEQAAQLDEKAAQLDEQAAQLDEKAAELDEQAAQLNEEALNLKKEAAQLDEQAAQLNEEALKIDEQVAQLNEQALQLNEKAVQITSNKEEIEQVKEHVVKDRTDVGGLMEQRDERVNIGKVREVVIKEQAKIENEGFHVLDAGTGEWVVYDPEKHANIREENIVKLDLKTGRIQVHPSKQHLFIVGNEILVGGKRVSFTEVVAFTEEELAQMRAMLLRPVEVKVEEEDSQKHLSHTGATTSRYRESSSSPATSQMRGGFAVRQERVLQTDASSYEKSSKKFLDEALAKNSKKIQMELKRLEREILSHEILIEGIKRDDQNLSTMKATQQLQELQAKNRDLDAQYDAALQKFLDGIKGYQDEVPLPLQRKFKEVQIQLGQLEKLIPKAILVGGGTKEMVKVVGQVVAMKKEVVTIMTGLMTAAGKLYMSGNSERQPSSKA